MSWFPDTPLDEMPGTEPADGVLIERREILRMSIGAFALVSLGLPRKLFGQDSKTGELSWDNFINKAVPMAEKLVEEKEPDEDAYLNRVVELLKKLEIPEARFRGRGRIASSRHYSKRPFTVVQFKIQPGGGFPWHDHRKYNGVLFGVSGEARVRSYDLVEKEKRAPKGKTFEIRETADRTLTPGVASHLSRTRDNIHDVRAGKEGARLLDVFTFFERGGGSSYLNVENKPKDEEKKIYEASWK